MRCCVQADKVVLTQQLQANQQDLQAMQTSRDKAQRQLDDQHQLCTAADQRCSRLELVRSQLQTDLTNAQQQTTSLEVGCSRALPMASTALS